MERAKHFLDRVLGRVLIVLMGAAVLNVLWQVFARFVLNAPSSFTEELARFLLIWVGVLGAGYAAGQHDHLALELLPERLEGRAQEGLRIGIQGCILLFALVVLVGGGARLVYIQLTLGQTSASLGLPLGYVYLVLPLSGLVMSFYAACHIRGHLQTLRQETQTLRQEAQTLRQEAQTLRQEAEAGAEAGGASARGPAQADSNRLSEE